MPVAFAAGIYIHASLSDSTAAAAAARHPTGPIYHGRRYIRAISSATYVYIHQSAREVAPLPARGISARRKSLRALRAP